MSALPPISSQHSPLEGATDPDDTRVRCRNCQHLRRAAHGVQCGKTRHWMHQHLLRNCLEFYAIQGRRPHD